MMCSTLILRLLLFTTFGLLTAPPQNEDGSEVKDIAKKGLNLLVIMTDEHNFRTLGCYRDIMANEQAFVWGDGLAVETPNIDFLAQEGILFSKFYSVTPVCSPSRGSFVSGLYPQHTGVQQNDVPMFDHVVTFAKILEDSGYKTGYAGKWHLDGEGKPQWAPKRNFGFRDNKYMFNRGHWKKLTDTMNGPAVATDDGQPGALEGLDPNTYTTDFLTNKAIEFIEENSNVPFCYMLSYPDPHGPDVVRSPYDTMYTHMPFESPLTSLKPNVKLPFWASMVEAELDQAQYFGMVRCIDDNVGRLINTLQSEGLLENTIIIFTSDHGDMRGEHYRRNKSVPLEASAKVPFIVYSQSISHKGSTVSNAFNSVDFAPTLLSLMGFKRHKHMYGTDFSPLLRAPGKQDDWRDFTVVRSSTKRNLWIAGVTSRYKLVLSDQDPPWLLDLQENPDETINYIDTLQKRSAATVLARKLRDYARKRNDPFLQNTAMEADMLRLCKEQ